MALAAVNESRRILAMAYTLGDFTPELLAAAADVSKDNVYAVLRRNKELFEHCTSAVDSGSQTPVEPRRGRPVGWRRIRPSRLEEVENMVRELERAADGVRRPENPQDPPLELWAIEHTVLDVFQSMSDDDARWHVLQTAWKDFGICAASLPEHVTAEVTYRWAVCLPLLQICELDLRCDSPVAFEQLRSEFELLVRQILVFKDLLPSDYTAEVLSFIRRSRCGQALSMLPAPEQKRFQRQSQEQRPVRELEPARAKVTALMVQETG
jgi:hypothetical protein